MSALAHRPDLDPPYGIIADSDPCPCECGHVDPIIEGPIARPICDDGCYGSESDVALTLDRWTCIGGTRYMLIDSRED